MIFQVLDAFWLPGCSFRFWLHEGKSQHFWRQSIQTPRARESTQTLLFPASYVHKAWKSHWSIFWSTSEGEVECFGMTDCYPLAFSVPAVAMVAAFLMFLFGKSFFVTSPPSGNMVVKVSRCVVVRKFDQSLTNSTST
jgi:hypothetical protein